jgi:hypothetical protein
MTGAYAGARVVFATMHGKESLARDAFDSILGATVFAPPDLDTDQFGTFAGEITRTLSPRDAARTKARLGCALAGTPYGLASEGSFTGSLGGMVQHHELLLFADQQRGFEVVEQVVVGSPLAPARSITDVESALAYAHAVGFPDQGLVLRIGSDQPRIDKSIDSLDLLARTVREGLAAGCPVTLEPDFRAHNCPPRAEVIRSLAVTMATRLATECPSCATPGFGHVDVERGVPCADCGEPTQAVAADILGCALCPHTVRVPQAATRVDARWCDFCNP